MECALGLCNPTGQFSVQFCYFPKDFPIPRAMALAYPKVVLLRSTLSLSFTAVSDNTPPVSSKTFQDFGFFFDVNQTVTIAFNPSLSKKGGNTYPASGVSFDLPRLDDRRIKESAGREQSLLPLPDLFRKIEGDSARRGSNHEQKLQK